MGVYKYTYSCEKELNWTVSPVRYYFYPAKKILGSSCIDVWNIRPTFLAMGLFVLPMVYWGQESWPFPGETCLTGGPAIKNRRS